MTVKLTWLLVTISMLLLMMTTMTQCFVLFPIITLLQLHMSLTSQQEIHLFPFQHILISHLMCHIWVRILYIIFVFTISCHTICKSFWMLFSLQPVNSFFYTILAMISIICTQSIKHIHYLISVWLVAVQHNQDSKQNCIV